MMNRIIGKHQNRNTLFAKTTIAAMGMLLALTSLAQQLPINGNVVAGSADIATTGSAMTITQNSDRAVINWDTFDIGSSSSVTFNQLSSSSVALNRVGASAGQSAINGMLTANGHVMVLNPNGVMFGSDAAVNVGGLLASTGNVDNAEFMSGSNFSISGATGGTIANDGNINVSSGGLAAFVAPSLNNSGTIVVDSGRISLLNADAATVSLNGGLYEVAVSHALAGGSIDNTGTLNATGSNGMIAMTTSEDNLLSSVINLSGIQQANSIIIDGDHVVLASDLGTANVTGNSKTVDVHAGAEIQDAIDIATSGDVGAGATVNVYPGNYTESAVSRDIGIGTYTMGLLLNKDNLTLRGVDSNGNAITNKDNVAAWITAGDSPGFGMNHGVIADNITVEGLGFKPDVTNPNKTIEIAGDNFTFANSVVDNRSAATEGIGALYFGELIPGPTGEINRLTVTGSLFLDGSVSLQNGVGVDSVGNYLPAADRVIVGNEFIGSDNYRFGGVLLTGKMDEVTWRSLPIAAAIVTGNSFSELDEPILVRGEQEGVDLRQLMADNSFDRAVLVTDATGNARASLYQSYNYVLDDGSYISREKFSIQSAIQAGIDRALNGDTVSIGAGTYTQTSTLKVNKSVTLVGAGEGQTIIDRRGVTGYGISVNADDVTLKDFTLYGPAAFFASAYGIKVSPGGPADSRLTNFTITDVTSRGSGKAELDLNGVNSALIDHVTLDGAPVGDDNDTTQGAGLQLTDSANITVRNSTTRNNGWSGVALYQANRYYNQQTSDIVVEENNQFSESNPLYLQDESTLHDFGSLTLPGFNYAVRNMDLAEYTWMQQSLQDSIDFAVNLPTTSSSYVQEWNGNALTQNFHVGVGTLFGGETQALSIATAVGAADDGAIINVAAGSYSPFKTNINGPENLTIIGDKGAQISLDGSEPLQRIVDLRADGTVFKGFSINGGGTHVGISVSGQGVTVSDNAIDNVLTGIQTTTQYVEGNNTITGNSITNSGYGISLQNNSNTVADNIINVETEGFGIGSGGNTIHNNDLSIGVNGNHLQTYTTEDYAALPGADVDVLQVLGNNKFNRAVYITDGSNVTVQTIFGGIQSAIDESADGSVVNILAGTYAESLTVSKALTLNGSPGATLIVSDSGGGSSINGINIRSDGVTISNLDIAGPVDESYLSYDWLTKISRGIAVSANVTDFTIADNTIHDVRNGILIDGRGNTGSVIGNQIDNSKSGISVQYTDASGIAIADNSEGTFGNEWGLNLHLNGFLDNGSVHPNPYLSAPTADWQQALLDFSSSNNGWRVQDQGYSSANRTHVEVSTTGSPGNQGSLLAPISSLQNGVDAAVSGGTVNVAAGTYGEDVIVNSMSNIHLGGEIIANSFEFNSLFTLLGDTTLSTTGGDIAFNADIQGGARALDLFAGFGNDRGDVFVTSGGTEDQPLGSFAVVARNYELQGTLWVDDYSVDTTANVALSNNTLRAVGVGATNTINAGGDISGSTVSNGNSQVVSTGNVSVNITTAGAAVVRGNNIQSNVSGGSVVVEAEGSVGGSVKAATAATIKAKGSVQSDVNGDSVVVETDADVGGSVEAVQTVSVKAKGNVQSTLSAGNIVVEANGNVGGSVKATQTVSVKAQGNIESEVSANNVVVEARGNVGGSVKATKTAAVKAQGNIQSNVNGDSVVVDAQGDITGDIQAANTAAVNARNVESNVSAKTVSVAAQGNIGGTIIADDDVAITAQGSVQSNVSGKNVVVEAQGNVAGSVSADKVAVNASGNVQVNVAANTTQVQAGGMVKLSGSSSNVTVDASGGDLSGDFAQVSNVGKSSVAINGQPKVSEALANDGYNQKSLPATVTVRNNGAAMVPALNVKAPAPLSGFGTQLTRAAPAELLEIVDRGYSVEIDLAPRDDQYERDEQ